MQKTWSQEAQGHFEKLKKKIRMNWNAERMVGEESKSQRLFAMLKIFVIS